MSQDGEGESIAVKKVRFRTIKLHRPQDNKQQVIEENLKNLEIKSQKKRFAQACYYGEAGKSPLNRGAVNNNEIHKQPVHARLGNDKIRLRRMYHFNSMNNNGMILRTKKFLHNRNRNDSRLMGTARRTIFKRSSAQLRIQKIRQQRLTNNLMEMPFPQKIKLRRRRPDMPMLQSQPTNYTVEVNNSSTFTPPALLYNNSKHSVRDSLNKQLQAEIRMIQEQNPHEPQIIAPIPIHAIGYGVTTSTLHNRFSLL